MGHTHWSTLPAVGATTNRKDERQACAAASGCPGGVRLCVILWIRIWWIRRIPAWTQQLRIRLEPWLLRTPLPPFSGISQLRPRIYWIRIRTRSPFLRLQQLRTRQQPWPLRNPSQAFSGLQRLQQLHPPSYGYGYIPRSYGYASH